MTVYKKIQLIYDEHLHKLRNENEKQFIADMHNGVQGCPPNILDHALDEYLSPRQVEWINDIALYLDIEQ